MFPRRHRGEMFAWPSAPSQCLLGEEPGTKRGSHVYAGDGRRDHKQSCVSQRAKGAHLTQACLRWGGDAFLSSAGP